MKRPYRLVWLATLCAALVTPQIQAQFDGRVAKDFQQAVPHAQFYKQHGIVDAIYGTQLSSGVSPLESANSFVTQWDGLFGTDIGTLVPRTNDDGSPALQGVMYDRQTNTHKLTVFRFDQVYKDLPVFRSGIGFLVRNENNFPLVMTGFNIKSMAGFDGGQTIPAQAEVTPQILENVRQFIEDSRIIRAGKIRVRDIQVTNPRLMIWAGVDGVIVDNPKVAVAFIATHGSVQTYPDYQKELILASVATGEILWSESQIHFTDIQGTVSGQATDGIRAAECDPEAGFRLPYARVSVVGGNSAFADANGDFTIPHSGTSPVTVQSQLSGQWFEVRDQSAGNSVPTISLTVTPPGPANFMHNPSMQPTSTANVNGYIEANVVRDFVLYYEPNYPVIGTQAQFQVNTNINSTCNAFYDGSSINFYIAGGGCSNTSFSDVIHHEYGHHLIAVTGNGQGQMGEGSGDTMGVLIQDEPILAYGFTGNCNAGIRTADNTKQYPQTGEIHDAGQLISGCVWSTRNELIVTEPTAYRDISASLFLGMLIVRGQMQPGNSTIDPSITVMYLELDDDDNDIGNGTPHYNEIAAGFGVHNMDAPPLDLVNFQYPQGRPELISPSGGNAFTVNVLPGASTPVSGTGLLHVDRGNGFETIPMTEVSSNVYQADFPTSSLGTVLQYYVSVQTSSGPIQNNPPTAPTDSYSAISADSQVFVFHDDFEQDLGWTVATTATTGQWERGVPVGGGDRGDPPTDGDGSGKCYVTGNTDGDFDVDNGSTTLTSPVFDGSKGSNEETMISYFRWYNNVAGSNPEQDTFNIEVSNNNGATWSTLEIVGPSGAEVQGGWYYKTFRLSDYIMPTSQMKVRYIASDLDPQSIVEAGVDGVLIRRVSQNSTVVVHADSYQSVFGIKVEGQLASTFASDDQYLCYAAAPITVPQSTKLTFDGTLPYDNPIDFKFRLEAKGTRTGVKQKIELFNYVTGQYELLDSRDSTFTADSVVEVVPTGDILRFVEPGTAAVNARITFSGPKAKWFGCIDELAWEVQ